MGITAELVAAGGAHLDHLGDSSVFQYGRPLHRVTSGSHFLTVTRPQFEWALRSFLEYARGLPDPSIAELVSGAEPIGDILVHRYPARRRRHFERLPHRPAGRVTVRDALCTFNPVYGQGMTSAAFQAHALGRALDRYDPQGARFAAAYYRAEAKAVDAPWTMVAGGDFAFPETHGRKPRGTDMVNRYGRRVSPAARSSPAVARAFASVVHLTNPPTHLFRPSIVARVTSDALSSRTGSP